MATNENIQDINKKLHDACYNWDVQGIKDALQHGADINNLNDSGESPLSHAIFGIVGSLWDADRNVSDEEWLKTRERIYNECILIIDLLLENGADIDLFDENKCGVSPLHQTYYSLALPVTKHLLKKGANPNTNCYRNEGSYRWEHIRSSILGSIYESYDEENYAEEHEIWLEVIAAGGRLFDWGYCPETHEDIGKFCLYIDPSRTDDHIFYACGPYCCGTAETVTVEDANDEPFTISLNTVKNLQQWHLDFRENLRNTNYDWKAWKQRGYELAQQVADLLPDFVALFYIHENDEVVKQYYNDGNLYLYKEGALIRIK